MPGSQRTSASGPARAASGAFALMPGGGLGVQKSFYLYTYIDNAYHIYVFMVQTSELTRPVPHFPSTLKKLRLSGDFPPPMILIFISPPFFPSSLLWRGFYFLCF